MCQDIRNYESDENWDFPGSPVAKTLSLHCQEQRFDPWMGN